MTDDLKRVGLVFKEDGAVDFRKSLQLTNAQLRENYNQFKLVQTQWDASTSKTTKLKAELDYLNNAYDIQKDKVSTLRMQLNELENADEKDTLAIEKKRAELTKAETSLQKYANQIKEVSRQLKITGEDITKFGENIEKVGGKIEKVGQKVSAFSTATATAFVACAKTAIDFEDAFTGVEKTVDGTEEQMAELKQGIRDMAKEIPSTTTEISAVAEAAGQLGIQTDNVLEFTKTMINMGNATNLSADEAATTLARFANVTKMSQSDFGKLGSVIVALGNNFATTESEIAQMGMNLASAGTQVGMTQPQIMALATALSSVGLEAQAGGTAFSKVMVNMQLAVEKGGDSLKDFASVAGMTTKEFKEKFKTDATGAIMAFVDGLSKSGERGKSAIKVLDDMGITETRLRDALLRSANASEIMNKAVTLGNEAWEDNTALTEEANKRYGNLKSRITMAINKLKDMAITVGNKLMPTVEKAIDWLDKAVKKFDSLNDEQLDTIINIGKIAIVLGPAITMIGKLTTGIGRAVKAFGTIKTSIEVMKGVTTSTSTAVNGLATVFGAVTSPIGLACLAIGAAIGGIAIAVHMAEKDSKEAFKNMGDSASDFVTGIENAKSHLNDFNSTLFVTAEEQQQLEQQMNDVQQGITNICKTASDERRGYTQEEITQLDEYFTKLRELNQREIEIQQAIANAVTQQATTNAQTFQGNLEAYKVQSQEWIKTAEEQKDKTIEIINTQTIEEIALLNQRFGDEANMQNEAYATEYNNIMAQKQEKIDAANLEVSEVTQAYADGYLQRSMQNQDFYNTITQFNSQVEEENSRHNKKIQSIEDGHFNWVLGKQKDTRIENDKHNSEMKKIWKEMSKNMTKEQEAQLGVWLAQVAQTEMYGGQIDDKTKKIVDSILESYESMPPRTQKTMKDAMTPMLTAMQDAEPGLYAKASGIASNILSRLRKAFDIHSPSRKTKEIFKNVMLGMEKGIEEEEKNLYNKTQDVADNVMDNLDGMNHKKQVGLKISSNANSSVIDYNKLSTVLTNSFLTALNKCKLTLDEDGFARIVKDELYKVV